MSEEKKHIFQMDENGQIRLAFVGTISELEAQIKKDFDDVVSKTKAGIKRYEEELSKLPKPDLDNITAENAEACRRYVHYATMKVKDTAWLESAKCPTLEDGVYFVIDNIGKVVSMVEK